MNNQEKLDALKAELAEIECKLAEVPKLEERRRQLRPGYNRTGEIEVARRELRDEAFPIYHKGQWRTERIVAIDGKWITLRNDGREDKAVDRYKRDTGWRERARNDRGAIDPAKALRIWEEHQGKETP